MEDSILLYLLKVSVAFLFFSVAYILFLRNDTFVKTRRFYFLFTYTFSILYPLLIIELPVREQAFAIPTYWLSQVEIGGSETSETNPELSLTAILLIVAGVVSLGLLCRFFIQLLSVCRLRMINKVKIVDGYKVICVNDVDIPPFSFFNWIFIGKSSLDSERLSEVLLHEQIHARQWHSFDILLSELVCIFFWWNPLAWYIRHEVKINLEYLADKGVLENGCNCRHYQYTLLQTFTTGENGIPIINNFNVSQLKKRITMMNKQRTPLSRSLKYLLILPLSLALVLGNAVQASGKMMDITSDIMLSDSSESQTQLTDSIVPNVKTEGTIIKITEVKDDGKPKDVFNTVEEMPRYPGGETAMMEFIKTNLKYPKSAQDAQIEGRVVIRFVVNKDGAISDAKVLRGLNPECDAEALRTVNAMPKWTPGKQKGVAVPVYYTLPIVFKLTKSGKEESNTKPSALPNNLLVILDGVAIDQQKMKSIDPSSIDKLEVVKDAAKIAVYGDAAKGKDGVIVITLKK